MIRRSVGRFVVATLAIVVVSSTGASGSPPIPLEVARRGASVQMRQLPTVPAPFAAARVKWPAANQVALTFDDGPCARKTRRTVDVLGDTVGTFFIIGGQLRNNPSEAIYAASRGHSIQNHTMDHPHLRSLDQRGVFYQLQSATDEIIKVIGIRPTVYRPPYGSTDARVRSLTSSWGWSEAMWNGGAPQMNSNSSQIIGAVRSQMRRARLTNKGLVLLFHDCSGNFGGMIGALPTVISMLRDDNWEFVAMA